jgi:hypothetical protein
MMVLAMYLLLSASRFSASSASYLAAFLEAAIFSANDILNNFN